MKFRYKRFGNHLRPVIPIKISYGNRSVEYNVLIDSGADSSIFDDRLAPLLGIDIATGTPARVGGIAGQTALYFIHPVKIEVGGWPIEMQVGFLPLPVGTFNYGVVGHEGFFEHFVVTFDLLKEEIELRQRKKS